MTLASSYSPLPGSTSYKALEIIRRDGSIARGPLADALGINVGALPDVVEPLVKHALVLKARDKVGHTCYQTPEHVGAKPQEPAADLAQVGATLAEYFRSNAPVPSAPKHAPPAATPAVQEIAEEAPTVPPQRLERLWVALGSDGCLLIRRGGRMETYDKAETQEIARYFSAIGLDAWAAA
jgi:hypothetical protein